MQTDFEDFLAEHEQTHGLGTLPSTALPTIPKKPRGRRTPRVIQTDLEEFIAEGKAAQAAKAIVAAATSAAVDPAQPVLDSDFGTEDVLQQSAQPMQENSERSVGSIPLSIMAVVPAMGCEVGMEDHSLRFLKEAAHIRTKETQQPAYDYRFLLRPIQEMLTPLRQRKDKEKRLAVTVCGHARRKTVNVHLIDKGNGTQRASVTGIFRCGNGEACPVCARHVAALRAKRYRIAHEAVNALGGTMLTLVFTIDHLPEESLGPLLADLKSASTGVRQDRIWNEKIAPLLHAVGAMTDVHVRWSRRGGWHPHLHVTLPCLTSDKTALEKGATMLIKRFVERLARLKRRASIKRQSLTMLDARPNAYPAHHHRRAQVEGKLADEMDDDTSLSPFDLAELAADGDASMRALFVEFVEATRGQKSGVITANMAKKLGIEPGTDPGPGFDETTRLGTIPAEAWTKLLDLNLTGTFLSHVETFGRDGWPRARWWALDQTGLVPPVLKLLADEIIHLLVAADRFDDPAYRQMAQDMVGWRREEWTAKHSPKIVADIMAYAEALWRHITVDEGRLERLMDNVTIWADKRIMRRWRGLSHTTLPVGDSPPHAETVPHGSVSDHVGQNAPISQQA